jgi:hypothetical protein
MHLVQFVASYFTLWSSSARNDDDDDDDDHDHHHHQNIENHQYQVLLLRVYQLSSNK